MMDPIDISGLNVLLLPVKQREPVSESPMLVPVACSPCNHWNVSFEIDLDGAKCSCKRCGTEVSPMFVLKMLMEQESRWMRTRAAYADEMKRLGERSRTKCQHCERITRISR